MEEQLSCMSDLWLFESLSPAEKEYFRTLFRRPVYQKGEYLFSEGEPSSAVFVVIEGRIKLSKTTDDGSEVILGFLTPHSLFGEDVLFNDSLHGLSAQALVASRLCACYKSDFEALVAQNSAVATKVIRVLGDRLSRMTDQLTDMAIYDTQDRLARTLARLALEHGEQTRDGRRLNFRLTHDDLGALVGSSRVMVTNVLKALKKSGIVQDDPEHRLTVSNRFLEELASNPPAAPALTPPDCQCFTRRNI